MKKPKLILLLLLFVTQLNAQQQQPPFWDDIQAFKREDSVHQPVKNAILFVGSSSFTKWTDVADYFPGYKIINRGFGGSTLVDQIRYVNNIVFPYHPREIIIYCGENDLASSDKVTGQMVYERFVHLFQLIRKKLPNIPIVFISLKPSPSRWQLRQKMITANNKIKAFLATKQNTAFVDVYHKMLDKEGLPIKEIYLGDSLHMNAKGYAIWQKELKPHLLK
jgi:lysophospholipase L1-like esterase